MTFIRHPAAEWRIAIDSYRRPHPIASKTLALLERHSIDPDRVTVFVADTAELASYAAALAGTPWASRLVVAVPGMTPARNFITAWYPPGTPLLHLDDDLDDLVQLAGKSTTPVPDLTRFIHQGFECCEAAGTALFGVYPTSNPFYMRPKVTTGLRFCIGCCYGTYTNPGQPWATITVPDKDDFERTIKAYLQFGTVIRFDYIAPVTRFAKNPGGQQAHDRLPLMEAAADHLLTTYPDLVRLSTAKRTTPWPELKLIDRGPA